jgi:hypothetical protein
MEMFFIRADRPACRCFSWTAFLEPGAHVLFGAPVCSAERSCQTPVKTTIVAWPAGAALKRTPPLAGLKAIRVPTGIFSG